MRNHEDGCTAGRGGGVDSYCRQRIRRERCARNPNWNAPSGASVCAASDGDPVCPLMVLLRIQSRAFSPTCMPSLARTYPCSSSCMRHVHVHNATPHVQGGKSLFQAWQHLRHACICGMRICMDGPSTQSLTRSRVMSSRYLCSTRHGSQLQAAHDHADHPQPRSAAGVRTCIALAAEVHL